MIDTDIVEHNARIIATEVRRLGLPIFGMTQQMGRNGDFCAALIRGGVPPPAAIDYYGMIDAPDPATAAVGDTVVFGFRPQIFVTRGWAPSTTHLVASPTGRRSRTHIRVGMDVQRALQGYGHAGR